MNGHQSEILVYSVDLSLFVPAYLNEVNYSTYWLHQRITEGYSLRYHSLAYVNIRASSFKHQYVSRMHLQITSNRT
jgi:hypothetical protein